MGSITRLPVAALTYFYDHHDEMIASMKASIAEVESYPSPANVSREELLRRGKDAS
jgi:hypothetical protein